MNRRDIIKSTLTNRDRLPDGNPDGGRVPGGSGLPPSRPQHVVSGAVGAMGRSLGQIARAADAARAMVAAGDAVVELRAADLDGSFVSDRLDLAGPGYVELRDSIRERGQQVPILVRPHPERPDRYQIAYGHRRARALAELGRSVRAVVRALSDEELVIAQGQENSLRSDLSYIEKARFAMALQDREIGNPVIMSALGMEKTQFSKLLSIGRRIPEWLSAAIGPAPRAGRPRWSLLGEKLQDLRPEAELEGLVRRADFLALESDARFARVLAELTGPARIARRSLEPVKDPAGRTVATMDVTGSRLAVNVDDEVVPGFGDYVAAHLPRLLLAFLSKQEGGADTE